MKIYKITEAALAGDSKARGLLTEMGGKPMKNNVDTSGDQGDSCRNKGETKCNLDAQ